MDDIKKEIGKGRKKEKEFWEKEKGKVMVDEGLKKRRIEGF